MSSIRTIIIDDELHWQLIIKQFAMKIPELSVEAVFSDIHSAREFLSDHDVDLIFLDIQIQDENGIDFIKQLSKSFAVIIISSHSSFALDGYSISAVDYLTKPLEFDKFEMAVHKAFKHVQMLEAVSKSRKIGGFDKDYFLIKDEQGLLKVPFTDVFYVSAFENYIKVFTANKTHLVLTTLLHFEKSINNHPFVRVHRSYIVNLNYIKIINKDFCILDNDVELPISDIYRNDIQEIFTEGKIIKR